MKNYSMKTLSLLLLCLSLPLSNLLWAHGDDDRDHAPAAAKAKYDDHGHGDDEHDHDHEEEPTQVSLTAEVAQASTLTTAVAASGVLQKRIKLYGTLEVDPQRISHIQARYPGLIRQVNPVVGAQVKAGEVLARVESNESLRDYMLVSPIAGRVVERHANTGEFSGDKVLFTILDERVLELHLQVFPSDAAKIKTGQTLWLDNHGQQQKAVIDFITPRLGSSPTLEIHAAVENDSNQWVPNQAVAAWVSVAEIPVSLRIDKRALQQLRGDWVVFVKEENGDGKVNYHSRAVTLGREDNDYVELLSGLQAGEHYVVENSYLLKADLEKSSAGHEH